MLNSGIRIRAGLFIALMLMAVILSGCKSKMDLALEQAAAADREIRQGHYRGPLHGIPFGVKDLFDTKGILTTWGAEPFQKRVAERDATVVERLRNAGAVLMAKLSMGALAQGGLWFKGMTKTPWNTERTSSGSSAGSASATKARTPKCSPICAPAGPKHPIAKTHHAAQRA